MLNLAVFAAPVLRDQNGFNVFGLNFWYNTDIKSKH